MMRLGVVMSLIVLLLPSSASGRRQEPGVRTWTIEDIRRILKTSTPDEVLATEIARHKGVVTPLEFEQLKKEGLGPKAAIELAAWVQGAPPASPTTGAAGATRSPASGRTSDTTAPTQQAQPAPASVRRPVRAPVRFRSDLWSLPDEEFLGFVKIPQGYFTMGSDSSRDPLATEDEQPQHKVFLDTYYIARYEVTISQFEAFVRSQAYEANLGGRTFKGSPDTPVHGVSWKEGFLYSNWLDRMLRESRVAPTGVHQILTTGDQKCRVTLPSEAEWEKAARGTDARIYPWGNQPDRSKATYLAPLNAGPAPVGSFPDGASPYGVMDMASNVAEWTRTISDSTYPYKPSDPARETITSDVLRNADRVYRSGVWHTSPRFLRSASRGHGEGTFLASGFRVAISCSVATLK